MTHNPHRWRSTTTTTSYIGATKQLAALGMQHGCSCTKLGRLGRGSSVAFMGTWPSSAVRPVMALPHTSTSDHGGMEDSR